LVLGQWYFCHYTYNPTTRQHSIRLWDDTASAWFPNSPWTAIATEVMYLGAADWTFGGRSDGSSSRAYDGLLDEMVIWSGILSDADAERVKNGVFGTGAILPVVMHHYTKNIRSR